MRRNLGDVPTEWAKHLRSRGEKRGQHLSHKRQYWHQLRMALKNKLRREGE